MLQQAMFRVGHCSCYGDVCLVVEQTFKIIDVFVFFSWFPLQTRRYNQTLLQLAPNVQALFAYTAVCCFGLNNKLKRKEIEDMSDDELQPSGHFTQDLLLMALLEMKEDRKLLVGTCQALAQNTVSCIKQCNAELLLEFKKMSINSENENTVYIRESLPV